MEPIAIVGMACRFPGASNPCEFWNLLIQGRDAVGEIPPDRWNVDAYYSPTPRTRGKMNTRWGGFLERVDRFDANFFGICDREASFMDPQQRVVLEVAWESLETAGVVPARIAGSRTGVFIGISNFDYNRLLCRDVSTMDAYSSTGTILAIAANRLSYLLNLRGPSLALDTACSSSLVAVHLACQSLRSGESTLALAGGVNLILTPEVSIILSQTGLMSSRGRCRTFDSSADGYVRSEGCGIVVLERLSDAQCNERKILALIRGSAVNQDGCTNGLTAPSARAQQAVIQDALANAGVEPAQLGHLEAHGTGTVLGDLIEVRALRATLLKGRSREDRCAISSVKTNIGHTEAAAGIAGLMKTVLMLQHETIPSHLHLAELNRHIKTEGTPLFVPTAPLRWERGTTPRVAGVSSFGIGGTNAHAILEEAPNEPARLAIDRRPSHILVLSAKSDDCLRELARRYADFFLPPQDQFLADICFTARNGRSHFPYRLAIVADSAAEMRKQLLSFLDGILTESLKYRLVPCRTSPKVAFVFSDGPETADQAQRLADVQPVFRDAYCERRNTALGQPRSPFQDALTALWKSWGILAAVTIDHDRANPEDARARGGLADSTIELSLEIGPACAGLREILIELATLYTHGVEVDWLGFDQDFSHRIVALPTYPFERKRYWFTDVEPVQRGLDVESESGSVASRLHLFGGEPIQGRSGDS